MDRFKLNTSDYISYEITPNNFDKLTNKLKYIENYGTGIRRMYEAYRNTEKHPSFDVRPNSFKVILPNINWDKNELPQPILQKLGVNYVHFKYLWKSNTKGNSRKTRYICLPCAQSFKTANSRR